MRAAGGVMRPGSRGHFAESGVLKFPGMGRTDNVHIQPRSNSYVIPADIVSGLGQGNTDAGAQVLDQAFKTGPYGVPLPPAGGGYHGPRGRAEGGGIDRQDALVAGGEYLLTPEQVTAIGGGDYNTGKNALDKWVVQARSSIIDEMRKLKGPIR